MDLNKIYLYLQITLAIIMTLIALIVLFKYIFQKRDKNGNGKIDEEEKLTKADIEYAKKFIQESIGIIINGLQNNIEIKPKTAENLLMNELKKEIKERQKSKNKEQKKENKENEIQKNNT